jgi:glucose-6-phosphate isomerase
VLSEVGMLPAELMGLNPAKFRQLNNLVKNKRFMNLLIANVNSIISMLKKGKSNSIMLNYDPKLKNFLEWYKQLVGESLGKNGKGLLPVISEMPKDNHSVMQLYLDGVKKNFYTFFSIKDNSSLKINTILNSNKFLEDRTVSEIKLFQKKATENVFERKKIPFRSFEIIKLDEKTIGELFIFFILETILLGNVLKVNPYDQPAVESIKKETKKFLNF